MATYILLSKVTTDGMQTLHSNPQRLKAADKEIEQLGCKVVAQYALLGEYDFLTIVEAPDNETAAHLSLDLGTHGTLEISTHAAVDIDAFIGKLQGGGHIAKED